MISVIAHVTADCEGLITCLPRGHEYELTRDDGDGVVKFDVHDVDDLTSGMEQALDTHPGVISYDLVESGTAWPNWKPKT